MYITTTPINNIQNLTQEDFFDYLTRIVLFKSDDLIKAKRKEQDDNKQKINSFRNELMNRKRALIGLANDLERKRKMYSVLNKIDSLRKEGVLIGKNKEKIMKILKEIESYSAHNLQKLEDKLDVYAPSLPKMTYS